MAVQDWLTTRPIAHRGLHGGPEGAEENSPAAFLQAVRHGVPFELDVQLTADRELLVVHDAFLRTTRDGTPVPVAGATLSEIRALARPGDAPVTLATALDLVRGAVPVVVDVRRWRAGTARGLEEAVAAAVTGYRGEIALQSFDPRSVYRLRRLLPHRPVGQISGALASAPLLLAVAGRTMATNMLTRPDFVSFELAALPSRALRFWRRRGLPVIGWTVHSPAELAAAASEIDNYFFELFEGHLPCHPAPQPSQQGS
ncbi:glycerophosphodiester phosphodiesterase family protein [Streptomyces sp. NPDC002838]|uniref:glycerophosphodiester phosphodiesterase family protein n=1 Tax=Streptomyces sp. NPDC002838 TaxID=3154436 RepID=UPI0033231F6F